MFDALRGIARDNQVIYTTHSPVMISELWADDSVRLVTLRNGQTIIDTVDIETVISELGIKYEDVLNPRVIVFVEGDSDVEFFEYLTIKLRPELESFLHRRIKFIPSDGYRNIHSFAYMKIVNSMNVSAEFYIIADSDGKDPADKICWLLHQIKSKIKDVKDEANLKDKIKILREYAIESYLLDSNILHSAFPGIEKEKLSRMVSLYRKKYSSALSEVKKGLMKFQEFQKYFTPKNFLDIDIKKHPAKFKKFSELFDNNSEFLQTRDLIATKCEEIRKRGDSIIHFILSKANLGEVIFKEPKEIINDILSRTDATK